jgi:hypothetical protein
LFILDFPLKKPSLKTLLIMIAFVMITVGIIFAYTKFRLPHHDDKGNQLVSGLNEDYNEP